MGTASPITAYVIACLGSALGLLSSERARNATGGTRKWWLVVAALSIGGLGIWGMHFTAMLGTWMGATVAYDIPITLLSMLVAVVVVGIGLFLVLRLDNNEHDLWWPLLVGGLVTGLGVAAMHYTGMAGIVIGATVSYDFLFVALSLVIAVVAATAALWFTRTVKGPLAVAGASLVMGVAVTGMHYTGMFAMDVTLDPAAPVVTDNSQDLITSLIVAGAGFSVIIIFLLALTTSDEEQREDAELLDRVMRRTGQV
ncbi:MHYT domain-containing protein, NO-binding membrane sensor [Lentzea fradiae]|uniref:MHYT domain-containing protein, NO-binding membrane sensor n=1 Tax=Lentzea fradiae TaxID=200378 RepID=A0A1G7KCI6_9PSEU|nr:MHYT domain-containing protein [Lentzea fradiae]SDF34740.1 MHYT domain-containing protein, NO-binding membrane sensor [Lentzea fradiae]